MVCIIFHEQEIPTTSHVVLMFHDVVDTAQLLNPPKLSETAFNSNMQFPVLNHYFSTRAMAKVGFHTIFGDGHPFHMAFAILIVENLW